jgi:hypothetical protein
MQDGLPLAREGDRLVRLAEVAHASEHVGVELPVAANLDEGQRSPEVPPDRRVAAGVVCHPSGFFCFDAVSPFLCSCP